jgi:archaellum component FlaC
MTGTIDDSFMDNVDEWSGLPDMPTFQTYTVFVKAGNYVYSIWEDVTFAKFSVVDKEWDFSLAETPSPVGYGCNLVYPGAGDYLYVNKGAGSKIFWRYSISGDTWEELADLPDVTTEDTCATATATCIYVCRGDSRTFWRYTIATDTWDTLSDVANHSPDNYPSLVYPGSGDYLYLVYYYNGRDFAKYQISTDTWTDLGNTVIPDSTRISEFWYPGTGNYIYGWRWDRSYDQCFTRYNFTTNTWDTLGDDENRLPRYANRGILYEYNEKLYLLNTYNYNEPLVFNPSTEKWEDLCAFDYTLNYGSRFIWDGDDTIYCSPGGNRRDQFQKYSITDNEWTQLALCPNNYYPCTGSDVTLHNGYMYMTRGGNTNYFCRYNIAGDGWETLSTPPANFYYGGSLCAVGDYIYAFRGYNSSAFYRYDPATDTWDDGAVTDAPAGVYYGGALCYPGSGDFIYASRGNHTKTFWKYSISGNEWTEVAEAPFNFYYKCTLSYPGSGNYIYALPGYYQRWGRYNFSTDTWEELDPLGDISSSYYGVMAACGDTIYMDYYGDRSMVTYSISQAEITNGCSFNNYYRYYGSTVYPNTGDIVYMFYGGDRSSNVWKFSLSQGKYVGFIQTPFRMVGGTKACYPGSGNLIYVLRGGESKDFWTYDFVNDTWDQLEDAPVRIFYGSQLDGGDGVLYACQGRDTSYSTTDDYSYVFMKYTIATDTWEQLADLPYEIRRNYQYGKYLVYDDTQETCYYMPPTTGRWYIYNTDTDSWSQKSSPASSGNRAALWHDSDSTIYYYRSDSDYLYSYDTSANQWTSIGYGCFGNRGGYDTDIISPDNNLLYIYNPYSYARFGRYDVSENAWEGPYAYSYAISGGYTVTICRGEDTDTLYCLQSDRFYKYTISTNRFSGYRSTYSDLGWRVDGYDPKSIYPGGNYFYVTRGTDTTNFGRYNISQNDWDEMTAPPHPFGAGHDICATDSDNLYVVRGGGTTYFWRYDVNSDSWEELNAVPATVSYGGGIIYPGYGDYIYLVRGSGTQDFYRYTISTNSWDSLTDVPICANYYGGDLCYPDIGDYIYFKSARTDYGAYSQDFLRYSISNNTWEFIDEAPRGGYDGACLVYPGSGDYMFWYPGRERYEWYKYRVFKQGDYTSPVKNIGVNNEFDDASWNESGGGYCQLKARTSNNASMSDATDWSAIPSSIIVSGGDLSDLSPYVQDTEKYLQYKMYLFADDLNDLPILDDVTISWNEYPQASEIISSAYDSTEVHNRLMKLTWQETAVSGTDVRYQLSTAPDDNGSPGVWGAWLGPSGTQTFNDDYSTETDYTYADEVEVSAGVGRLKMIYDTFTYTQRLVLDNTDSETAYTDSCFAIDIDSTNKHFWEHVKSDGGDIRFVDSQGNALSYCFNEPAFGASFNYSAQTARIFVQVPSVAAAAKTSIYLKYGNSEATNLSDPALFDVPVTNGLVIWYEFEDESGSSTAADSSGNGYTGTVNGNPIWADGKFGQYIRLDGSDYIQTDYTVPQADGDSATFAAWIYPETDNNWRFIFGTEDSGYDWGLTQINTGLYVYNGSNYYDTGQDLTLSEWQHVAVTFEPYWTKVYYGGELIYQSQSIGFDASSNPLTIGRRAQDSNYYFIGRLDQVLVYNRALSASEIDQLYEHNPYMTIDQYFALAENNNTCPSLSGWPYRQTIEIVNNSGDLSDYQIPITLDEKSEGFWSKCLSTGYDVRFVDEDNSTVLDYYRDSWDYDNQTASFWIKDPSLESGETKNIYLYYGRSDAADVSDFDSVCVKDYNETGYNISAVDFDGDGDLITVSDSETLDITDEVTIEANMKYENTTWLPGFAYRKLTTIDNSGGIERTNTGIEFDVTYVDGKMNADYSDLRFTDDDGSLLPYRIVESDASEATVLVTIPLIPADSTKDIYLYYGNSDAVDQSDDTLSSMPQEDLMGWWRFDEGSGTTAEDSSGNGNTGTVEGATWTTGKFNQALYFDGSNDYVNIGHDATINPGRPFTFCFWINMPGSGSWQQLISNASWGGSPGYCTMMDPPQQLIMTLNGSECTSPRQNLNLPTNEWVHVAYVVSTTTCTLYIDGEYRYSWNHSGSLSTSSYDTYIGWSSRGSYDHYLGSMDEVAIYARALSEGDIGRVMEGRGLGLPASFGSEEPQPAIDQTVISKSGAYELKFSQLGLTGYINGTELVSTPNYTSDDFVNVAFTYDGATANIYVNGSLQDTAVQAGSITTNASDLIIGDSFKGSLDEIKIWNIARTAGNVNDSKNKCLSSAESGLVCLLQLNENTGTSAADSTVNGNDGALSGDTSWTTDTFKYSNGKANFLYHMDEGLGTTLTDDTGNGNTVTLDNTSWADTDLTGFSDGNSIECNGSTSEATAITSSTLNITGQISIEAWIKPDTATGIHLILDKGSDTQQDNIRSNYKLYQYSDGVIFGFYNEEERTHEYPDFITAGETYQVVATFDESTNAVKIYVNGVSCYDGYETSTMLTNADNMFIAREDSGNYGFDGVIDEIRVYNRVLSASEVLCHYEHRLHTVAEPSIYNVYEPPASSTIGAYAANNPVIQPIVGVFYDADHYPIEFSELTNTPGRTGIKYQISSDGYRWYWYDGDSWSLVEEGYAQANTAAEVNTNLSAFLASHATGDFYYRAYLHGDPYAMKTPSLDNIAIITLNDITYYTDPNGNTAINPVHTDANNDQWFRYKAILYSDGENSPIVDETTLEYINAYLTVTAPNGGEEFNVTSEQAITWSSQAITSEDGFVKIEYSSDGGNTYETIADDETNDGSYNWAIPDDPSNNVLVKISSKDFPVVYDVSDEAFSILSLKITSPNGSEIWEQGVIHNITWESYGAIPNNILQIEYSTDNGSNWESVIAATPDDGQYEWIVPELESDQMLIKVSSPENASIADNSDAIFSVVPVPAFTITSPAGGEEWVMGSEHDISWQTNSLQFSDTVTLSYSTDEFINSTEIESGVSIGTPQGANNNNDIIGSYSWIIPEDASDSVKVRVVEDSVPPGRDTQQAKSKISSAFSIIEPSVTITAPTSSNTWVAGDTEEITWTSIGGVSDDLLLEYKVTDTGDWVEIATGEANDGSYTWTNIPTDAAGDIVYIRLTDNERETVTDESDAFTILALPIVTVTDPNGGEEAIIGSEYTVTWTSIGNELLAGGDYYSLINIYYSTDNGDSWNIIAYHTGNTGSYPWLVPDVETNQALIKVAVDIDGDESIIYDLSDANFDILIPTITITSPNGGEAWYATGGYDITWTTVGTVHDNLTIEFYDGSDWSTIATSQANDGTYSWPSVNDVVTSDALIRITDASRPAVTDTSNSSFTVMAPYITVSVPNGGEEYVIGESSDITWSSAGYAVGAISDNLTIQYSINSGSDWSTITTGEANDGTYYWDTIPDTASTHCLVKIFDGDRPATEDMSDNQFSIVEPYVRITAPNGGETWPIGTEQNITWTSAGTISDNLTIQYSKDNFGSDIHTITTGQENDGTFPWTVPDDYSTTVKVRLTDADRPTVTDDSDASFSITYPTITITSPNGGELWTVDDEENITWTSIGDVNDNLTIEYSKDNFVSDAHTIATGEANDGTYAWEIPDDVSATVRVRITDASRSAVWDKSNADFTILPVPTLTITSPESGDTWRLGTEQTITWEDNGGLISNNLKIEISTGGPWSELVTGVSNTGTYNWTVPDNSDYVSAAARLKITDANRETTYDESDEFAIAYPLITITSPNGGEYWAVGDEAPVTWTSVGAVSDNLVISYSTDSGSHYYTAASGETNDGAYAWTVPDAPSSNCLLRIQDGNRPNNVLDVSDASFTILSVPTITVTAPNGGEEYVLGDTMDITWTWRGLSISDNLMIDYALDGDFSDPSKRQIIASSGIENDGSYSWVITEDAVTGSSLKMRITDYERTLITDQGDGYFRIRGGFNVTNPTGGESWTALSEHNITWNTQGGIPRVNLQYSTDGGSNWITIANGVTNTNSYTWTLPDVQTTNAKVRVVDYTDNTVVNESEAFNIVYQTVQFRILDYDTMQHLNELNVNEPVSGWMVSDNSLESPITRTTTYPYDSYTSFFTKDEYIDNSVTWSPPTSGTDTYVVTLYMESTAAAQVSWEAILTYSYSPASDTLTAVGSLQRKGKLVGAAEHELPNLGPATLVIYNEDNTIRTTLSAALPNQTTAMYNFTYADTEFEAGEVYPAILTINYNEQNYASDNNIDVGSEILQYQFFTETASQLATTTSTIQSSITAQTSAIQSQLTSQTSEISGLITSSEENIKSDTAKILTAAEETIPAAQSATQSTLESFMKSEILNTEGQVRSGDELAIRYRTHSGLAPTIDVYDADNAQLISKGLMREIGTTGIYEYPLEFKNTWGRGDFTIVCSESTKGTLDALSMNVISTDIESIAGDLGAVVGATANLPDLEDITDSLRAQLTVVESSLSSVTQGVTQQLEGELNELENVFEHLSSISEQVKAISSQHNINLDKLYEVSKDKAEDVNYLVNKTQELKAAIELNQKLLEDVSNEPVTQTWYEYK